jgi:hypothetical protein
MTRSILRLIRPAFLASVLVLSVSALLHGGSGRAETSPSAPSATECTSEIVAEDGVPTASAALGFCAYTCETCWDSADCPLLGGFPQRCQDYCW